jgi:hypothetical protein
MRKIIAALLATAALMAPASAQRRERAEGGVQAAPEQTEASEARAQRQLAREGMRQALGGGDRQERREARQERREDRPELRQERREDRQEVRQERRENRPEFRQERREDRQEFRQERREDRQGFRQERREDRQDLQQGEVTRREFRRDRAEDVRDFRRDRFEDRRDFRRDRFEDRRDYRGDRNNWSGWNNNRGGNWNREWRRDPRYNWQDWRQRNRGSYRFPQYYAPRGWSYGYRRFSLGVILSAPLFSQNYWINDPWDYRLPPADGPYRWVRYYNDVVLVDVRDGRVVDVIHDFFW